MLEQKMLRENYGSSHKAFPFEIAKIRTLTDEEARVW